MGRLRTIKRGDSRFYVDPATQEKVPGVTSILNMLPKPFLTYWAAKVVAECAVDNVQSVVGLAMKDPKGAVDYLKRAPRRSTGSSADVGTEVHGLFEKIARGERVGRQHPEIEPFVDHIRDFHARFKPKYHSVEDAVWSETHRYAGSYDAICEIDGEMVMLDAKTTKSGVHEEVALQLSAYAFADYIVNQAGDRVEMPAITAGAVLHLRPEGWKLVPARVDRDVFEVFLTLRRVFDWDRETKATVIGDPLFDSIASTGSERRA